MSESLRQLAESAVEHDKAVVARLQHERLHWQEEAQKLNKIVHAQRDRIRDLESVPDRQLLLRIATCLHQVRFHLVQPRLYDEARELEQKLREHFKL